MYHKWQSYNVWFLRYGAQQTEFFVILDRFLPFYPLTNSKIKILKKWKKRLEISLFYTCVPQKWQSCDVWFLRYGAQRTKFLSFWIVFCLFTALTTQKIKILKKWKNTWRYHHFTHVYHNDNHMMYGSWDMECDRIFLSFWTVFCPFTTLRTQKTKILKKWKKNKTKHMEILSFYTCVQ